VAPRETKENSVETPAGAVKANGSTASARGAPSTKTVKIWLSLVRPLLARIFGQVAPRPGRTGRDDGEIHRLLIDSRE
jgi:hypothetical protein